MLRDLPFAVKDTARLQICITSVKDVGADYTSFVKSTTEGEPAFAQDFSRQARSRRRRIKMLGKNERRAHKMDNNRRAE